MLVSVIIPTFNRASVVCRAIESVLNQSYKSIEIIVVDDGSSDDTEERIKKYPQVKYYKISNSGVSFARNFGVEKSSAEYIAFLDSDDEWKTKKIELQVEFFKKNPDKRIVYTDEFWLRNSKVVKKNSSQQKYEGDVFKHCLNSCFIGPSSVLMEKKLFFQYDRFDSNFIVCEDYDLWLRISYAEEIGLIKDELVIKYGGESDQLSTMYPAMDFWRIKAMYKFLETTKIKSEERQLIASIINQKSVYLKKGFIKYNRLKDLSDLEQILSNL